MTGLFRAEVYEAKKRLLNGDVICIPPLKNMMLYIFLLVSLCAAGGWASFGSYNRTERVKGMIVPSRGVSNIYANNSGVVKSILIEEGDTVTVGQPLAKISVEQVAGAGENLGTISVQAATKEEEILRTQLVQAGKRQQLDHSRLLSLIETLHQEKSALIEQRKIQSEIVKSTHDAFAPLGSILKKGYIAKTEYEARRQIMLREEQSLRQLDQALASKAAALSDAKASLAKLPIETETHIADLQRQITALTKQKAEAAFGQQSYLILAPVAGHISAINTSPGRAATSNRPLFTIIPSDSVLEAEVFAPSRAIGFVKPGQDVRLMYDAFPYQRFGSFHGLVSSVSRTVLSPSELDAPIAVTEPVYRLRITLDRSEISAYGTSVPLQSGMTLVANIVLEKRSFMDWLIDPITAIKD